MRNRIMNLERVLGNEHETLNHSEAKLAFIEMSYDPIPFPRRNHHTQPAGPNALPSPSDCTRLSGLGALVF
jgi:hypothetical protein